MKKISLFFLLAFFFFIPNASALEYNYDYITNYNVPIRTTILYNNGVNLQLGVGTMGDILMTGSTTYQKIVNRSYQFTTETFTMGKNYPTWVQTYIGRQMTGNLYSYSLLVCSNVALGSSNFNIGLTGYQSYYFPSYYYKSQTWSTVSSNMSEYVAGTGLNYCYDISGFGSYKSDTTTISLKMQPSSAISGVRLYILGYKLEDLGYYHENLVDDIESMMSSVFSSAGVATKSDIANTNRKIDQVNQQVSNINDSINNDDTTESSNEANSFFSGFTTDTYGLTSVITAPLTLIGNIASNQCSPLPLQAPFINQTINLPCFDSIYSQHFGAFYEIYQLVTFGLIAYWVCIRIFNLVKDFKNPDHDEIEVMDL